MQSQLFFYRKKVLALVKFSKERGNVKIIRLTRISEKGVEHYQTWQGTKIWTAVCRVHTRYTSWKHFLEIDRSTVDKNTAKLLEQTVGFIGSRLIRDSDIGPKLRQRHFIVFIFTSLLESCKQIFIFISSVQTRRTARIRIVCGAKLQCSVC